MPALIAVAAWSGGPPAPDSLAGHLVVVAFLSLNLPGSLRALHSLEAWHEAYARYGLQVIGVQVPEFAFAAEPAGFLATTRRLGIGFPIGLDPALEVSQAFGAGERPRILVTDARGVVRFDRSGPEAIAEAEREILDRLRAARPEIRFPASGVGENAPATAAHPPVHLGRARVEGGPLADAAPGEPATFTAQLRYQVEGAAYVPFPVGRWTPGADGVTAARGGAENLIALRYHAGALGAVLGPGESGPVRVWVLRDERWLPEAARGADVRVDGRGASYVLVDAPRFYELTREDRGTHVVKLAPESPGATFYTITFEPAEPAGR
jgi:thioredoxin family protein/AhpC/TSA family protein